MKKMFNLTTDEFKKKKKERNDRRTANTDYVARTATNAATNAARTAIGEQTSHDKGEATLVMINAARTANNEQTSYEKRDATVLAKGAAGQITRISKDTTRHIVLTAVLNAGGQGLAWETRSSSTKTRTKTQTKTHNCEPPSEERAWIVFFE
jgi:hypothetical protein